ncbi:MAG: hypothetical protein LBR76_06825 [Oscillospiraceae bacterium]|jgi:hypothetical protein|nr:hypothetical protein [Oscillospiraceae bacterium]
MMYPEWKRKFVDSIDAAEYNKGVDGGKMNALPNGDKAVIPIKKLTQYSLDFEKEPNKAAAFKSALGYTKETADKLIDNIHSNISKFSTTSKGNNGFGDIYEIIMQLTGVNGKTANVLTGWIIEKGTDFPRLTSAYVTKKRLRK